MYVPPFDSVLRALGMDRATYDRASKIPVPKELFKLLMKAALSGSDFNEAGYLKENPDIAQAVRTGEIDSPREHYIGFGYFEGRFGGTPTVDERWYLATYSDVAHAVKTGKVQSAAEHYAVIGASEGRSPNADYMPVAARWKKALVNG